MSEQSGSGTGCFFKAVGCGCLVVLVLFLLSAGVSLYFLRKMYFTMVLPLLDTAPNAIPLVTPDDNATLYLERLELWVKEIEKSGDGEPLTLTEHQLNAILRADEEMAETIGPYVYVDLEPSEARAFLSVPLGEFTSFFAGQYLNGQIAVTSEHFRGRPTLRIVDIVTKVPLPPAIMKELRKSDFAADQKDLAWLRDNLAAIYLAKDAVTLYPKAATNIPTPLPLAVPEGVEADEADTNLVLTTE